VKVGVQQTELQDLPPAPHSADSAVLKVLAAGVCGADVKWYRQEHAEPRILGHENVGVIESIPPGLARRWGVEEGDLVALEEYLPCGHCSWCRTGEYRHCAECDPLVSRNLRFGSTPTSVEPGLWGGYAEYLHLPANAVMHRVPPGVSPERAAFALPLGNGFQWTHLDGRVGPGSSVLIQGPGQQGIGCAIAAREAGAGLVIVSGRAADALRLKLAEAIGATVIDVDSHDLLEAVESLTGGDGVDVSIDTSGGSPSTIHTALRALRRKEGVAVLQPATVDDFPLELVNRKAITVRMTRGHSYRAVEMALVLLRSERYPFDELNTHRFGLDQVDTAIRIAGGELGSSVHVVVTPWQQSPTGTRADGHDS